MTISDKTQVNCHVSVGIKEIYKAELFEMVLYDVKKFIPIY